MSLIDYNFPYEILRNTFTIKGFEYFMIFDEGHFMTVKLRKSGTKSGTKNISKDSLAYWLARVERRKYKYKGKLRERSEY